MWYRSGEKARKTYYSLGESFVSFMKAHVRFLRESNTIESEFEKPYYDFEYNFMHLDIPQPDWWDFSFIVPSEIVPPGGTVPGGDGVGCVISIEPPLPGEVAEMILFDPFPVWVIWGRPGGATTCGICTEAPFCHIGFSGGGGSFSGWGGGAGDCTLSIVGPGSCSDSGEGSVACGGTYKEESACAGKESIRFTGLVVCNGLCGSNDVCADFWDVPCDDCDGVEAMEWADEWTDETHPPEIVQGGSQVLSFSGGQGDFDWLILSPEFYFDSGLSVTSETTTARSNTIYASESACGMCAVQVTDNCDQVLIMFLLCDVNSGWKNITSAVANGDGEDYLVACPNCFDSSYCLGATGGSNYWTGTGTNPRYLYNLAHFYSTVEGWITVRTRSQYSPVVGSSVYPDNCDNCTLDPVDCGYCVSTKAHAGFCNYECAEVTPAVVAAGQGACNVPGLCSPDGYSIIKAYLATLCNAYGCFGECDACGSKRLFSEVNYGVYCMTQTAFRRYYIECA